MSNTGNHFRKYVAPGAENNPMLRAKGNLSYLQFIDLVKRLWAEAHPKIPIVTSGADDPAQYPCIIYSLQLRKTHPNEPKMRYRENVIDRKDGGDQQHTHIIGGQRYQNIIYFQAIGEAQNVDTVEYLIEAFEDFMMEFIPVFKELGVSELVYARRLSDTEQQRPGANTVARTVSYMVTTEKVVSSSHERLREVLVSARTWLEESQPFYDSGTIFDSSPRYHLSGPDAVLQFSVSQNAINEAASFDEVLFVIPATNFRIGDVIYIHPSSESNLSGFFVISNLIGEPYRLDVSYTLVRRGYGEDPDVANPDISLLKEGTGRLSYIPSKYPGKIIDEFKGSIGDATPNS